ncbi:hypothetical protein B0G76_2246 [Paraburkholderia sp. BL23I1N1]|nr:hypothetical protein B0G76_2246 [Paraburkholderia sp. BL23I1N1]
MVGSRFVEINYYVSTKTEVHFYNERAYAIAVAVL